MSDDSWPPLCPVWCRLVTASTNPVTTFTRPTGPFLSEWAKCQPGNTQNGGTVLPIVNLMADSESGSPAFYSSFLVDLTICLSRLVSEIFACGRQTDRQTDGRTDGQTTRTITIAGPHIVAGQLIWCTGFSRGERLRSAWLIKDQTLNAT